MKLGSILRWLLPALIPPICAPPLLAVGEGGGMGWAPGAKVAAAEEVSEPQVAVAYDGRVHLVWREGPTASLPRSRIAYREFDGAQWLEPRTISAEGRWARAPSLAVDPAGRPHVVWLESGASASWFLVRYGHRPAGGGWIEAERASYSERIGFEGRPRLALLPAGDVVVVWGDDQSLGNPEAFWNRRFPPAPGGGPAGPGAGRWLGTQPLSPLDEHHSGDVVLEPMGDGRLAALWLDRLREGFQPVVRVFGGEAWSPPIPALGAEPDLLSPTLVYGEGALHLFYAVRQAIVVQTAREHLFFEDAVQFPVGEVLPRFQAEALDGRRVLLIHRDQVGDEKILLAREFSDDARTFAGVSSVAGSVDLGGGSFSLSVSASGQPHLVWDDRGPERKEKVLYHSAYRERRDPRFRRGDLDGLGLDLSDPIAILGGHFAGGPQSSCPDSSDADDDGHVNITDAVHLLRYLFQSGEPPPAPFPACGDDPTPDILICSAHDCGA